MRRTLLLAAAMMSIAGCRRPDLDEVRAAFKAEHPGYDVVSVQRGEPKDPLDVYRIKYHRPGEVTVRMELWRYLPEKKAEAAAPPLKDTTDRAEKDTAAPRPPI